MKRSAVMRSKFSWVACLAFALTLTLSLASCSSDDSSSSSSSGGKTSSTKKDGGGTSATDRPPAVLWGATELADENPDPGVVEVRITAAPAKVNMNGKEVDVIAYNGSVPGPLLRLKRNQIVIIHFTNKFDEPTTIHWHGLRIPDSMDGSPRLQTPVAPGESFTYTFEVPDPGTFWYHPHVNTYAQRARGLYGPIVVEGDYDPVYDLERVLSVDDVLFDDAGNITAPSLSGLLTLTGRVGNVFVTNGKSLATQPKITVAKGKVERWRIVNASNARSMRLVLEGAKARFVGADAGLFTSPVAMPSQLLLPVGGRVELEVSYDTVGTARLINITPNKDGDERATLLEATVGEGSAPREITWPTIPQAVDVRPATSEFSMEFDYSQASTITWMINGESNPKDPLLTVSRGATVRMTLINKTPVMDHPFHLHGQFFRVNDPAWPGLRDTVLVTATKPVEIIAYLDNPGMWMAHCHILEHAEAGMMAHIMVQGGGTMSSSGAGH